MPAYDAERLAREGIAPGAMARKHGIPWEGNPVSLAGRIRMWRERDWKLVVDASGRGELYDLRTDPDELDNRIDDPRAASVRQRLERSLAAWARRHGIDDMPAHGAHDAD